MTFRERMAFASKQAQQTKTKTKTKTKTASPIAARNQVKRKLTPEQYRTATLERVLTKIKLMKETI